MMLVGRDRNNGGVNDRYGDVLIAEVLEVLRKKNPDDVEFVFHFRPPMNTGDDSP